MQEFRVQREKIHTKIWFNQTVQTTYTPPYTCSIKQAFTFFMHEELVFDERTDRTNNMFTLHNNEH